MWVQGTGERSVPASEFFLGYRQVDLKPHEVLYKVCDYLCRCATIPHMDIYARVMPAAPLSRARDLSAGLLSFSGPACLLSAQVHNLEPCLRRVSQSSSAQLGLARRYQ